MAIPPSRPSVVARGIAEQAVRQTPERVGTPLRAPRGRFPERLAAAGNTSLRPRAAASDPLWRPRNGAGLVVYRVQSLGEVREGLALDGWSTEGEPFELPPGPCVVFRDPGQQRLAAYELVRPGLVRRFD